MNQETSSAPNEDLAETLPVRKKPSYALTCFLMLRLLGLVYVAAFYSLLTQVLPLIGEHGLLPASLYLKRVSDARWPGFLLLPSLFWVHLSDSFLLALSGLGLLLSIVVLCGYANAMVLAILWILYLSFVHIGQIFYGYGWEILLCETGFLAIFLCHFRQGRPLVWQPVRAPILWLFRWLALRIMLGAGLIKLRGDACWLDLTCLDFHFETQPLPNPLSPLFHFLPSWLHKIGVLWNHLNELILPLGIFAPRRVRHFAAISMILFQGSLILSGNLSFLNYLTIVPLLACLDDEWLSKLLPRRLCQAAKSLPSAAASTRFVVMIVCGLILLLSIAPALNLISAQQRMNGSFDPLNLVNTYGAFGSVGKERYAVIFEGTSDAIPDETAHFVPYEFKCQPGDIARRPCVLSPLQLRLDWQVWFAAMSNPLAEPWTLHLVYKLLHNDAATLSLFAANPFASAPPRYIRAERYRYHMVGYGQSGWWRRERIGSFLPPLSADNEEFRAILAQMQWPLWPK